VAATSRRGSLAATEERLGYLYIAPWLIGFVVFVLGPMVVSLYFAFTNYEIPLSPRFVGLVNFRRALFEDDTMRTALGNTAYYVGLVVPIGLALSLMLALMLDRDLPGKALFRTVYYLPSIVPLVAATLLWTYLLQPEYGFVNNLLWSVGIEGPLWFNSTLWAKPALVLIALWVGAGGPRMIIFLAGLQSVPSEMYEAAEVDGAGALSKFRHITLPLLSPTIFFNMVVGVIAAFKVFATAYVSTQGGPGDATRFYVLYLYQNAFQFFKAGYASALAWILFLVVLAFTLVQFYVGRKWVYYESPTGE
jgi:multiple sugar transport system permease protein